MKIKRILSAAMAGAMLLSCTAVLGGCRKQQVVEKTTVDHVYRVTTLDKPEGMNYAQQLFVAGDRLYMSYTYYSEDYSQREKRTYSMALDGSDLRKETLPALEDPVSEDENTSSNIQSVTPAADGTIWRVLYTYQYNMETGEYSETHYIQRMMLDGTELLSVNGEDIWGPPSDNPEERVWHYPDYFTAVDGGVVFVDNQLLYYLSDTGKVECRVDMSEISDRGWIQAILSGSGSISLIYADYNESGQQLSLIPVDMENGALGTPAELDSDVFQNVWRFFSGPGYTFYYNDDEALYGYDAATGTSTMLMHFLNSDVTSNCMNRLIILDSDTFVSNGYDDISGEQELMLLKRVPEEELVPKYVLTLATLGSIWSVQSDVIRFNRQSDEYRITVKNYDPNDYNTDTTGETDYNDLMQSALNELNNDIIAGRVPDILMVNEYIQMDSYISKGLFADLYEYIDRDERFTREDFLSNVLDAFAIDGKLYELAPSFNVETLVGKKSMIGDRSGWTMKEFVEWTKTIPEGSVVFYDMTRDQLLEMFCTYAYEEFVDTTTGECHFDTEDFKMVLEYVNTLSTESIWEQQDEDGMDADFWENYDNRFRSDKTMLEQLYLSNFNTLTSYMNNTFYTDEELVMVGLPSMDRSGSVIYATASYAISARSALVDGAWDFVSMFLTEEYQDDISYNFPLRISSLEKMADDAVVRAEEQKKAYEERQANGGYDYTYGGGIIYETMPAAAVTSAAVETAAVETAEESEETAEITDADGDGIADGGDIAVDDLVPAPVVPMQQDPRTFLDREMADEIIAFLKTLSHVRRNNTKVNNIIKEEAGMYFAGQKSLDETVKLIQNRASILVAESR